MAAARKKVDDDDHLRLLREIASIGQNRFCFDCGQRGPTYVNMAVGSFVCTTCSGHLRGLNPPHRVKSIAMASFTADEMDFIRSRGNEFCRKVWGPPKEELERRAMVDDSNARLVDLLMQKYEKKRWYTQPTDEMYQEARKLHSLSSGKPPEPAVTTQPAYHMSGSQSIPNMYGVHSIQRPSPGGSVRSSVGPVASPLSPIKSMTLTLSSPVGVSHSTTTTTTQQQQQQQQNYTDSGSFANFANFEAMQTNTATSRPTHHPVSTPAVQPAVPLPAAPAVAQLPPPPQRVSASHMQLHTFPSNNSPVRYAPGPGQTTFFSDKYAALSNLDRASSAINWDGRMESSQAQSTAPSSWPTGEQFVSSVCRQFVDTDVSPGSSVPYTVPQSSSSNPFAMPSSIPTLPIPSTSSASLPVVTSAPPPQYVLVQTSSGPCYVPVGYAPFSGVIMPPVLPPGTAPGIFATPPTAATAPQFVSPHPLPFAVYGQTSATNPFLQNGDAVRRDNVTNPFL